MKTSSALQSLIDASFVNGELSAKEKDVLVYRAVAEGLNQDEFEIYLDSLVYRSNSNKKGFLKTFAAHNFLNSKYFDDCDVQWTIFHDDNTVVNYQKVF